MDGCVGDYKWFEDSANEDGDSSYGGSISAPGTRRASFFYHFPPMPVFATPHRTIRSTLYPPCNPPPPLAIPPPLGGGGGRSLGPKSIQNTRRQRKFDKMPKAPKLIHTVILWYNFVVQPPPPLWREPSRHWWGDYKGDVRYLLAVSKNLAHPLQPIYDDGNGGSGKWWE